MSYIQIAFFFAILFCESFGTLLSFGFLVPSEADLWSVQGADTVITLYWGKEIMQCTVKPNQFSTWFDCDQQTSLYCYDASIVSSYMMHLDLLASNSLGIKALRVIDTSGSYYYYDFCSTIAMDWDNTFQSTGICNNWQVTKWNFICVSMNDPYCGTYSSLDIELQFPNNNNEALVTLSEPVQITCAPTLQPTNAPTYTNCEADGEIKHINWNELLNSVDNSGEIPYLSFNMNFNSNKFEMTFDIDLEYIGSSSDGAFDLEYNLGTTYVIDFQSFGISGNFIDKPGNCQNRIQSSFDLVDFEQYWSYSEYPYLNDLGSNMYLAYPPPSNYWQLSIDNDSCTPIRYQATFNWNELSSCTNYNGDNLIDIINDDINGLITLNGVIYVNLVSPYRMDKTDSGIYRTFPLIQQDFSVSITNNINILSSTDIELFR
eukprot:245755_1